MSDDDAADVPAGGDAVDWTTAEFWRIEGVELARLLGAAEMLVQIQGISQEAALAEAFERLHRADPVEALREASDTPTPTPGGHWMRVRRSDRALHVEVSPRMGPSAVLGFPAPRPTLEEGRF